MNEENPANPLPNNTSVIDQSSTEQKEKYPVGLIFILILTGMAILGSIMTIVNPMLIFGTYVVTGFPALLYSLIQMGIHITLFVWLIQRKEFGRMLGIAVSAYSMLLMASTYLFYIFFPFEMMEVYESVMPGYSNFMSPEFNTLLYGLMTVFHWVVGGAVILYLIKKKHYFRVIK